MSLYERESFIFYRSFFEAIRELPNTDQLDIYNAIVNYGLNGEINNLTGISKSIFTLVKPQLDANNRRYENGKKGAEHGKKGGRPKKSISSENPDVTPNDKEKNNDKENEKNNINEKNVDLIYNFYPPECPTRKSSTGKSEKNKNQIRKLLKYRTVDELKEIIDIYVKVTRDSNSFLKNFGSFLDELPDLSELKKVGLDDRMCEWEIPSMSKIRKHTYKQYITDLRRFGGEENVKFIRFID